MRCHILTQYCLGLRYLFLTADHANRNAIARISYSSSPTLNNNSFSGREFQLVRFPDPLICRKCKCAVL